MLVERRTRAAPFFSLCVPQYNRTSFLLEALRSVAAQTDQDLEVCISDDRSTDGRRDELLTYLNDSGLSFAYRVQEKNTGYDGNLRSAIGLARGRYCLLMGNDDALKGPDALANLKAGMAALGPAGVVICDFEDFANGRRAFRIRKTANYGAGPHVAAAHFRNFSFVSGVVLEREPAQAVATDRWDGSEMYQTFVGCRLIASGRPLLELEQVLFRKDVQVSGEGVDSYVTRPKVATGPIVERRLPLTQLGRVVADAVAPHLEGRERQAVPERVFLQLLLFTYPFWLVEYRRVQSWRYAAGVGLGMRLSRLAEGVSLGPLRRLRLRVVYGLATAAGLTVPLGLFAALQGPLYRLAKAFR